MCLAIWVFLEKFHPIKITKGGIGRSRTVATSKTELFVIIFNGFHPLIIFTNCSILDVAAVLDPSLVGLEIRPYDYGMW